MTERGYDVIERADEVIRRVYAAIERLHVVVGRVYAMIQRVHDATECGEHLKNGGTL